MQERLEALLRPQYRYPWSASLLALTTDDASGLTVGSARSKSSSVVGHLKVLLAADPSPACSWGSASVAPDTPPAGSITTPQPREEYLHTAASEAATAAADTPPEAAASPARGQPPATLSDGRRHCWTCLERALPTLAAGELKDDELAELRKGFQGERLLPCVSGKWAQVDAGVCWNDDPWVADALGVVARLACVSISVRAYGPPAHGTVLASAIRKAILAAEPPLWDMTHMTLESERRQRIGAVNGLLQNFRVFVVPSFTARLHLVRVAAAAVPGSGPLAAAPAVWQRRQQAPQPAAVAAGGRRNSTDAPVVTLERQPPPPAVMAGSRLFMLQDGACNNLKAVSLELTRLLNCGRPWPALVARLLVLLCSALGLPPLRYEGLPRVAGWRQALWTQPAVQVLLGELQPAATEWLAQKLRS
ncbi:hypothetical protein PLESTM_000271100 [Pleodorina starrii]|nr:hypothetical protein PLESTM_000271100 [Pleodorina starrii]